jgi:hypothetical protein
VMCLRQTSILSGRPNYQISAPVPKGALSPSVRISDTVLPSQRIATQRGERVLIGLIGLTQACRPVQRSDARREMPRFCPDV